MSRKHSIGSPVRLSTTFAALVLAAGSVSADWVDLYPHGDIGDEVMREMHAAGSQAPSASGSAPRPHDAARMASGDIVDIAAGSGQFETLVAAVKQAGLVDTLKGDGPFTVFAPTDAAFAAIPDDRLQALLADKDALTQVLTYHVVPGKVTSDTLGSLASARTVQGQSVRFDTRGPGVQVDRANVLKADIMASNGVIHVIDQVILPN